MRGLALVCVVAAFGLVGASVARAEPCVVIVGAQIGFDAATGTVDVTVRGERIVAVTPTGQRPVAPAQDGAAAPVDCLRVEAAGQVLTPGFIDPVTQLGLVEVSMEPASVDTDLKAPFQDPSGQIRAAVRAELAFNPRSVLIPVARLGGVTSAIAVPSGGIISGRSFWIDLGGDPAGASLGGAPVAMHASLGARSESRAVAFQTLDAALQEALDFARRERDWSQNRTPGFLTSPLDLRALIPVARGELPLVVAVDRAADIEGLLRMTAGTPLRLVVLGGAEAWQVADALAARRVAVIVDPLTYGPGGFDQRSARADNAARLHAAGVPILLSTFSSHGVRRLRQLAGNAVRGGLSREAALDAITRVPAETFGLPDRGRVVAGAVANLALWSGDPFELDTRLVALWIHGAPVPLVSRQTALRDRYRHLPRP